MKISYSASNKYEECSFKYKLHYLDKLRDTKIHSPLFFGSAIDEALNVLLLKKKKELTDAEKLLANGCVKEVFINHLKNIYHNDQYIDVSMFPLASYYKSDLDENIFEDEDWEAINMVADDQTVLENFTYWTSLKRKGLMFLEEYEKNIMPQIEEVFAIQKHVILPDGKASLVGVIDFIASFVDEPGVKYIVDNKTSGKPYPKDAVSTSDQLHIYAEHEELHNAAFIVMEKKIRKRDPKVRINIVKGKINESQLNNTFDKVTNIFNNIKDEKFEKNWDSCWNYGKKCPYFDYCRNGSTKGLIKKGEDKNGNKS